MARTSGCVLEEAVGSIGAGGPEDGEGSAGGEGSPRALYTFPLEDDLPSKVLVDRLWRYHRLGDAARRVFAFYLLQFHRRREHRLYGFATTPQFARARFGITEREARELLRIARALEELRILDAAFARGRIGWSKIREVTRVATPDTEEEWLRFARERSAHEVELAVAGAEEGDSPPGEGELGTPRVDFPVSFKLSAMRKIFWEALKQKMHWELGPGHSIGDIIEYIARAMLRTDPEGKLPGRRERDLPVVQVVVHVGPDGKSWAESLDGPVPIPIEEAIAASRECEVVEVHDLEEGAGNPILFGERGSVPPGERAPAASARVRAAVSLREGHRCAVCRRQRKLIAHHLDARAHGGETRMGVLLGLCRSCHSNHHEGLLKLRVGPYGRLVVEDREGNPLDEEGIAAEVLEGD
ncbi:MAG TPA: HNH endonuclease signature motif containing protein, partial [Candidatus Methylomirabilis sp.]|nr:HNH endonuclease signature motif containing protein [Candidatus Methylomirabilis sp.]